jgi:hypothetical protein
MGATSVAGISQPGESPEIADKMIAAGLATNYPCLGEDQGAQYQGASIAADYRA